MRFLVTASYSAEGLAQLEQWGEVVYRPWEKEEYRFGEADILALLASDRFEAFITEADPVTAKVIEANPQLRFIGSCRAAPVDVDVTAATRLGIPLLCAPARNAQAVAEMWIGLVISFLRNISPAEKWLAEGRWVKGGENPYTLFKGSELFGKTVGLVGFGAVARRLAPLLEAFHCEIFYHDPYIAEAPYRQLALDALFETCDIVSLHLPETPATKGIIHAGLLGRMRRDTLFVNTSRAAVLDMAALKEMLLQRRIRGAVLDVIGEEPPVAADMEMAELENVLATPHICGASEEVPAHHSRIINRQIERLLRDGDISTAYNIRELRASAVRQDKKCIEMPE